MTPQSRCYTPVTDKTVGALLKHALRIRPAAGPSFVLALAAVLLALLSLQPDRSAEAAFVSVLPTEETAPVPDAGDAADDPAIWIHPTNPSLSTVIATDKLPGGGLGVYDLAGNQLFFYFAGNYNNVDLRYNFPLGAQRVALVGVSNRTDPISLDFYKVNVADRSLTLAGKIALTGLPITRPRGFAMYHSPVSGKYYAFTTDFSTNVVFQFELNGSSGSVTGTLVRQFDNGDTSEGMVVDDLLQRLYVAEELVGLWRYGAEPADGFTRTMVDTVTTTGGHLVSHIKNPALYYSGSSGGYLMVSSQGGGGSFQIYDRSSNAFVGEFKIPTGLTGVDAVTGQDGIEVTNFNLGSSFPNGLFVSQDFSNTNAGNGKSGNQNYKYVPVQNIANAFTPALPMNNAFDPRLIGAVGGPTPAPTPTGPTPSPSASPSPSPTPSPTPANMTTVVASEDAYISGQFPTNNFGSAVDLWTDSSPIQDTYMKFNLTHLAAQTIVSAKLRMWVTNGSGGAQNIKAVADNTWTEAGLIGNNAPAKGAVITSFTPGAGINASVEVDLTPTIAAAKGTVLSLAMDSASADGYQFSSKDAPTNKLQLVITLNATAPPTPALTPTPTPTPTPIPTPLPSNILAINPSDDTYVAGDLTANNFGAAWNLVTDG